MAGGDVGNRIAHDYQGQLHRRSARGVAKVGFEPQHSSATGQRLNNVGAGRDLEISKDRGLTTCSYATR